MINRRKLLLLSLVGGCILPVAGATAQHSPSLAASSEHDVRAFEAEVMSAYNTENADRAASHYAIDAFVFIPGQPPTRGREAIAANIRRFMEDPHFKLGYENEAIQISAGNDLAYTRGKLKVTYTSTETKAARTMISNYLLVMKRQANGSWQVIEDISF